MAGLIADSAGNLYGTTLEGGEKSDTCFPAGCGVVFKVDKTCKETVLYRFTGGADGGNPEAGLIADKVGNLYGTTFQGGASGFGTVFKLDTTGEETALYGFTGRADGSNPYAGLVRDSAGNLYGTTVGGGAFGFGTVFKLDATGEETVLYSFTGEADGGQPRTGLIRDTTGNLYGTTLFHGTSGYGVVFKLEP